MLCLRCAVVVIQAVIAMFITKTRGITGILVELGASIYDVCKFFRFFDPLPLVPVKNQLILFLLSAFWGPPTHCGRHIWKPPYGSACPGHARRAIRWGDAVEVTVGSDGHRGGDGEVELPAHFNGPLALLNMIEKLQILKLFY